MPRSRHQGAASFSKKRRLERDALPFVGVESLVSVIVYLLAVADEEERGPSIWPLQAFLSIHLGRKAGKSINGYGALSMNTMRVEFASQRLDAVACGDDEELAWEEKGRFNIF